MRANQRHAAAATMLPRPRRGCVERVFDTRFFSSFRFSGARLTFDDRRSDELRQALLEFFLVVVMLTFFDLRVIASFGL